MHSSTLVHSDEIIINYIMYLYGLKKKKKIQFKGITNLWGVPESKSSVSLGLAVDLENKTFSGIL